MIKIITLPAADFGINPEAKFVKEINILREKKDGELFEWHEIKNRI